MAMNIKELTVLIADDNERDYNTIRNLLLKLDMWKFNIKWVSTCRDTLDTIRQNQYDLYFLSHGFGSHQDRAFLYQELGQNPIVPLILLVENEKRSMIAKFVRFEVADYLPKRMLNEIDMERSVRYSLKYKQLTQSVEIKQRKLAIQNTIKRKRQEGTKPLQRHDDISLNGKFLIDYVQDGVILIQNYRIIMANDAFAKKIGFRVNDILGSDIRSLISIKDVKRIAYYYKEDKLLKEVSQEEQFRFIHKDESTIVPVRVTNSLITYQNNPAIVSTVQDVTEHRWLMAQLRKLTHALELSPVSIFMADVSGHIEYVNPQFSQITGYDWKEIIGQNIHTLQKNGCIPKHYTKLWDKTALGKKWHKEVKNYRKNGEQYWADTMVIPITNSAAGITHFLLLEEDITKRKDAINALAESEKRYRMVFDTNIEGVEMLDAMGVIFDCNSTYQRLVNYSHDEIIGKHATDFIVEQDRDAFSEKFLRLRDINHSDHETALINKDGEIIPVWKQMQTVYNPKGELMGIIVYNRDLTDRVKAVQSLSTITRAVDQNPDLIWITDPKGNFIYVNMAFTEVTGYTLQESIDENLRLFESEQVPAYGYESLWDTVSVGFEWRGEMKNVSKHGEEYWLYTVISPITDEDGKLTHFVAICENVTERQRLDSEIEDSHKRIERLVKEHISELTKTKNVNVQLKKEIGRRQRLEKALRQSRTRLQTRYKGIPAPSYAAWQHTKDDFILVDYNGLTAMTFHSGVIDPMTQKASVVFQNKPQTIKDLTRCYNEKIMIEREEEYQLLTTGETRYLVTSYAFVQPNLVMAYMEDISERREMEKQLQQQQEHFEASLADHASELFKINNALQYEVIRRKQAEEHLRANQIQHEKFLHEITGVREDLEIERFKHEQTKRELKGYQEHIDDFVDARTVSLRSENKRMQDKISGYTETEKALRDSADFLRKQYKAVPYPAYAWQSFGDDLVLVNYNDAATEIMHATSDLLGKTASEIFMDRKQVLSDFEHCLKKQTSIKREAPYELIKTGDVRYFITHYNFLPPNLVMVHMEDITEYKMVEEAFQKSEQRYLLSLDERAELICHYWPDGIIRFVNSGYYSYFNKEPDMIIGQELPFIYNEDIKKLEEHLNSLTSDNPVSAIEYRVEKPNGKIYWQQWMHRAIFDEYGQLLEIEAFGKDISRRKELGL